jgi:hypothetical protein
VVSVWGSAGGCANGDEDGGKNEAALDTEQATLVAAFAAKEDGNDEAWTSASGSEPFLVESCGFELIAQRVMHRFDTSKATSNMHSTTTIGTSRSTPSSSPRSAIVKTWAPSKGATAWRGADFSRARSHARKSGRPPA